jgi:hypothetical protein
MAKEKIMPPLPRPPAFVMSELMSQLFAGSTVEKQIAFKIASFVLEYNKTCSDAESLLLTKVQGELLPLTKR